MTGLVVQCPSMESILELVSTPTMRANAGTMVLAVAEKLASAPTITAADVKTMHNIFNSVPELRCPHIAAGLMRNTSSALIADEVRIRVRVRVRVKLDAKHLVCSHR